MKANFNLRYFRSISGLFVLSQVVSFSAQAGIYDVIVNALKRGTATQAGQAVESGTELTAAEAAAENRASAATTALSRDAKAGITEGAASVAAASESRTLGGKGAVGALADGILPEEASDGVAAASEQSVARAGGQVAEKSSKTGNPILDTFDASDRGSGVRARRIAKFIGQESLPFEPFFVSSNSPGSAHISFLKDITVGGETVSIGMFTDGKSRTRILLQAESGGWSSFGPNLSGLFRGITLPKDTKIAALFKSNRELEDRAWIDIPFQDTGKTMKEISDAIKANKNLMQLTSR